MKYYPMFVDMYDKLALVIGQYRVLDFKMQKLLEAGAKIKFVSSILPENIEADVKAGRIIHLNQDFNIEFLDDVWLVICGSDDENLKSRIKSETEKRKIFCNFVDEAPISSFISPTVISKGDITIAISTKGKSPALNRKLKKMISETIGDEYVHLADLLGDIRPKVIKNIIGQKQRAELFDSIVQNSNVMELVSNNKLDKVKMLIAEIVNQAISDQKKR